MSYVFNPEDVRDKIVENIHKLAKDQNFSKVVLGISGGKDSSVTAALCVRALGKENVYGVMLPDGKQSDILDSVRVCEVLGIPHITINISGIHEDLLSEVDFSNCNQNKNSFNVSYSKESDINVAPRLRMTILRYITQALGARLAGTGNLSEATVGYCTKDGDTSCDFSVLGGLTSVEVVQVGLTMEELPKELVLKTPSDGLCGMSDEEKLGVSYEDIHHFIRGDKAISRDIKAKIISMWAKSKHKRSLPTPLYIPEIPYSTYVPEE